MKVIQHNDFICSSPENFNWKLIDLEYKDIIKNILKLIKKSKDKQFNEGLKATLICFALKLEVNENSKKTKPKKENVMINNESEVIEKCYDKELETDYYIVNIHTRFPSKFTVYSNKRTEPDNFDAKVYCSICDPNNKKFNSKLIYFVERNGSDVDDPTFICKTCLAKMYEALNTAELYYEPRKKEINKYE